jgi:hypothetical protein
MKTTQNFITCKLVFGFGFKKEDVVALLAKYTQDGVIANFVEDIHIGCNRLAFAVVDIPASVSHQLVNDNVVKEMDMLASYGKPLSMAENCGAGGCCGGGCGP